MKKFYVTPANEIVKFDLTEGILAKSNEIPIDPNPRDDYDTQKKKEIWEGDGKIWE